MKSQPEGERERRGRDLSVHGRRRGSQVHVAEGEGCMPSERMQKKTKKQEKDTERARERLAFET